MLLTHTLLVLTAFVAGSRVTSTNNLVSEPLSMYNSTDLPPHVVGVRPPSTSSLAPSRADLAHSSTTSGQDNGLLPNGSSECGWCAHGLGWIGVALQVSCTPMA